jgi:phosphoribosyl-ATP pyrophosphohydrolase
MENIHLKRPRNIWIQKEYLLEFDMLSTLENLIKLARERKSAPIEGSYTNKLLTDKALSKSKVLEEIDELIEAIEEDTNKIHEAADVFYHLLMYLEANDVKIEEVMQELEKRKK